MKFCDDEPVELDCGHTAEAGETYIKHSIDLFRYGEKKKSSFICCDDDECLNYCLTSFFENNFESEDIHIKSAQEMADEYADLEYDRRFK